jgi:hypothetical protein
MPCKMTKGIVSAVGKFPNAGPGLGSNGCADQSRRSGGPLVDLRGEWAG